MDRLHWRVRVELDPDALAKYGVGLEDLRAALAAVNANSPKGAIQSGGRRFQIYTNDQAPKAKDYQDLVIAYRNGNAIRLSDVAEVVDSVESHWPAAVTDGKPSILLRIYGRRANVIATVDQIKARVERLRAALPTAIDVDIVSDRTTTIRRSLRDLEHALLIAGALVILTVFAFLRSARAILIPAIVVPVSILGTFGIMYLLKYSLNSVSLMALIIVTGLVIDDSVSRRGEHLTSYRERNAASASDAAGRSRSRLHRPCDEPRARHDFPAIAVHGGRDWPHPAPIRDDAFGRRHDLARRFAHRRSNALCACAGASIRSKAWMACSRL